MIPILLYSRISLFEIEKKKEKEEGKKRHRSDRNN